jgi:hypothetical protein
LAVVVVVEPMSSIPLVIAPSWWLEEEEEDFSTLKGIHLVGEMLVSPPLAAMQLTAVLVVSMDRAELLGLIPQPVVEVVAEDSIVTAGRIILAK